MRLAVASGIIEINYLANITRLPQPQRKPIWRPLEPSRLPELIVALSVANISRTIRCLIEWQLHTMIRPTVSATARWQDIDLDKFQ